MSLFFYDDAARFRPALLSGLRVWYDTSQSAYLTLISTAITNFLDRSGGSINSATQGTASARPIFTTNQINGLSSALFDGVNDAIYTTQTPAINNVFAGGATVFAVPAKITTVSRLWDKTTSTAAGHLFALTGSGNSLGFSFEQGTTANSAKFSANTVINASGCIITLSYDSNSMNTMPLVRTNGANVAVTTSQTGTGTVVSDAASDWYYMNRSDLARATGGDLCAFLIYNRILTAAEKVQVEVYLANMFGIYHPQANWINSYSAWQQTLINAWQINKDDAFTNTIYNPFAAIYDPTAAALGSTTSLADTGRGVNTATEATNPPVNTIAAIGADRGLLYNGTTTTLSAGSDTTVDDLFAAGGCYVGVLKPNTIGNGSGGCLFDKGGIISLRPTNASGGNCKLTFTQSFSVTSGQWTLTNTDVTFSTANIIAMTYSSANVANNPSIYVNSLIAKALTQNLVPTLTPTSDAAANMRLGANVGATQVIDGYIGKMVFLKSVPTTTQLTSVFNFLATEYGVTLT